MAPPQPTVKHAYFKCIHQNNYTEMYCGYIGKLKKAIEAVSYDREWL